MLSTVQHELDLTGLSEWDVRQHVQGIIDAQEHLYDQDVKGARDLQRA